MSFEANKAVVRRYFEDAPHDPDTCDQIFAPRFLFHTIQQAALTPQDGGIQPGRREGRL